MFTVGCFYCHLLLSIVMCTAGGGLSRDGEHCPGNGDSVWSSFWEGHSKRWPLCSLQQVAVGTKESGDGNSLGSSQLDSLLKPTLSVKVGKGMALTKICRFVSFLYLPRLVLGVDYKSKTRWCQTAVLLYLWCTELKISFCLVGITPQLQPGCESPCLTISDRVEAKGIHPEYGLRHWSESHNCGHTLEVQTRIWNESWPS